MKDKEGYYDLIDNDIKSRIIHYQKEAKLRDIDVVYKLGALLDGRSSDDSDTARYHRYKNYKNKDGNQRFISKAMLDALAEIFRCTTADLLNPQTSEGGKRKAKKAFIDGVSQKRAKLFKALENDKESIDELYFLYCELPEDESKRMIQALFTFMDQIYNNSFYSTSVKSIKKRADLMAKLIKTDTFYSRAEIILMRASDYLSEEDRPKALASYLEVIITTNDDTDEPFCRAASSILFLHKNWNEFPDEIYKALGSPEETISPINNQRDKDILNEYISENLKTQTSAKC